ncbi:MAG TPA: hypothetical protein VJ951_07095 [Bacteroidales bacterium]|nr:hypothetical protein [Bacteroidales bacterium]
MKILIKKTIFWIIAVLITLSASVYQRMTGPTYPKSVSFEVENQSYSIELPRSHGGETDCPVVLELPNSFIGEIVYRRFPTSESWDTIDLYRNNNTLLAFLPKQPPAGKLEYHVNLYHEDQLVNLELSENIVIRFKGAVPNWALIPHVLFMFFAMLWSNASGLQAAVKIKSYKRNSLTTLILLFIGGMIFGPIVQKFAFDAYWTGWPFGEDLTDNKVLAAVIVWFVAYFGNRKKDRHWLVIAAAVFLFLIYMIPHSIHGSELDYASGEVISASL